jgi:hypothetical protein
LLLDLEESTMSAHRHAEFFHDVAEGKGRNWEVHDRTQTFGWHTATIYLEEIYSNPTRWEVRRKTKTSRERFEEWYANRVCGMSKIAWEAWQEAERQMKEVSDESL